VRSSMEFNVTFLNGDETETKMLSFNQDLAASEQFELYVNSIPYLFPLRYLAKDATKRVTAVDRLAITTVAPGDRAYLDLRFYDDRDRAWFDALKLPESHKQHLVEIEFRRWKNRNRKQIIAFCFVFDNELELSGYDVFATVVINPVFDENCVRVDAEFARTHPQIFV